MKKFIDFEIVLILVIIILAIPLYLFIIGYIYEIDSSIIDENSLKLTAFIGIVAFVIVNLIMFFYNISKIVRTCMDKCLYKKSIKNQMNLDFEDNLELPTYGIVLASTIFYKTVRIELLKKYLQEYFKTKNIIDENNEVVESNSDKIKGFEKEFLPLIRRRDENNKFRIKPMEDEEREFNIQKEVEEELKKLEFIKHKSIGMILTEFLNGKNNEYVNKDFRHNPRFTFLMVCFLLICLIINTFLNIYVLFILAPFACILFVFNLSKIMLTKQGKMERIKLLYLRNRLKNSEDLTDEERLFYNVLKK